MNQETQDTLNRMSFEAARDALKAKKVTLEQVVEAIESQEYAGFCLACGSQADGVEPDAERYRCEACGAHLVYGAEQILIMVA
jgi:hypothetical protein